jgi:putative DNA methylase
MNLPRRLIEVDLPIKRISAHARREKSIRHGHISTLHIWWARRPLAACRAVICAALWPDPADENCPASFREAAEREMRSFAASAASIREVYDICDPEALKRYIEVSRDKSASKPISPIQLRELLLDFIADASAWEASINRTFLATARNLTQAAHESLGGLPGTRPLVVDPFAGGGAIPLEALRVGADAFASDLNPVAVLLNKVVLEYIPKYGQRLADQVRTWGQWIKQQAEKELGEFYPKDADHATPIAYLWARTIQCEGPNCGAEVPLMRSLWLAKKGKRSTVLKLVPHPRAKRVDFEIIENAKPSQVGDGTVARGSATCPCCGYTTPVASVRIQLKARSGGAADARLFCVVTTHADAQGRFYRLPNEKDVQAIEKAVAELERRKKNHRGDLPLVPDELTPRGGGSGAGRAFSQRNYGMELFGDLFTPRQLLALTTLSRLVREAGEKIAVAEEAGLAEAVQAVLAMAVDKQADMGNSLCRWEPVAQCPRLLFGRQAIGMIWDFAEGVGIGDSSGAWSIQMDRTFHVLEVIGSDWSQGLIQEASACALSHPNHSASAFITDPPYYDAVPYADLSDFFYVWLKRTLPHSLLPSFSDRLTPKSDECIVDEVKGKDKAYFEKTMGQAMAEGRRVLNPNGIGVVVFAHKSTAGWEAQLQAMVDAGWVMTGSWPLDTEMGSRLRAQDSAALASSIHLVCRPRAEGEQSIGDWREVLSELPVRIHQWLPRLADEGVVGADAIFACLGPALEVFSRFSRVEKASGEQVTLKEYLLYVWAAVSREALGMIFSGADSAGFEEDARLTAMWLWTLATGNGGSADTDSDETEDDTDESARKAKRTSGYSLEYDAARKIAQGLGVHLEKLGGLVEISGETAKLLAVGERACILFGKDQGNAPKSKRNKDQPSLFDELAVSEPGDGGWSEKSVQKPGVTTLDRLHQSMILFATGRAEALKRFLVDDGIGKDQRFWTLAQALSALYPAGTDEKRWVDGVMARKKGLGL